MQQAPIQFDLTAKKSQKPISFALNKVSKYFVNLFWDSAHDCDVHVILLKDDSHLNDPQNIISTYNPTLVLAENKSVNHVPGGSKPFCNHNGSVTHMGDVQSGIQLSDETPDESIKIDTSLLTSDISRIMFFVSIHPPTTAKFDQVKNARLVIAEENGAKLLQANVSSDFDSYDIAQLGSFKKNETTNEWEFDPSGMGLNGDFNSIVAATYKA